HDGEHLVARHVAQALREKVEGFPADGIVRLERLPGDPGRLHAVGRIDRHAARRQAAALQILVDAADSLAGTKVFVLHPRVGARPSPACSRLPGLNPMCPASLGTTTGDGPGTDPGRTRDGPGTDPGPSPVAGFGDGPSSVAGRR